MKLDQALKIVKLLERKKKITAKEVADLCECSLRSAYRYPDKISTALPIYTKQGKNGGWFLLEKDEVPKT